MVSPPSGLRFMEILTVLALLFLTYLIFQRWFWGLLMSLLVIGLGLGGLAALFTGNIGSGLAMLLIVWGIAKMFNMRSD